MGLSFDQSHALAEPVGRYGSDDSSGGLGDQRRHQRVIYSDPVQVRPIAAEASGLWAMIGQDLSETGVMLSSPELFPVHSRLLIWISVCEVSEPIAVVGRVIWVSREDIQERYQLGVEFEERSGLARAQLQQLVAQRRRADLGH
ncbi:MAG: PilZ domain-containing protein [Lamprobacter sp.]|uniref:PilZ domain-containing protein n=1 Tax=Lamprobacter sp. TaxID=3100796 RepID=UPI002B25D177|nr:PilZ domain-containing protein [Lamprobacter sp.]MEA3638882.1 PilZ domain-containing protein [Lamprobacter sp.]